MSEPSRHRVVVVGGGFGGLYAVQSMRRLPAEITLIDRRNFHLFQPLLYQVATGGLSPANIAAPLRSVFRSQNNVEVIQGNVDTIDASGHAVILSDGSRIAYDTLVLATGSTHHYFGHPEWEKLAPGLKTIEDATEIRRRVLGAFEAAERSTDPDEQRRFMTFLIVGGGPTGVEMAGAIAELAHHTLRKDFRRIDPADSRIILVEGLPRVLSHFPESLSESAKRSLERKGVEVWTDSLVTEMSPEQVTIKRGDQEENVDTSVVVWAAGVKASPLTDKLAEATGCDRTKSGQVIVEADLSVPGHPEILAIGDMAHVLDKDGSTPLPGVAPVAMQQGKYVADVIDRRMRGRSVDPFRYWDKGSMATIGRSSAVVDLYWFQFSGWFAWLTWLFVHIVYLVHFSNRMMVLMQWAWNYTTRNRSARLITGEQWPSGVNHEDQDANEKALAETRSST